jgi:hypothetical protein
MTFSEIVRQAISLARAADQARMAEGPDDDSPLVTLGGDVSTMRLRTAEERRLRDFLEAQAPEAVYGLTALSYLGRGDFDVKALRGHIQEVSETFGGPQWAARQMLGTMDLSELLEEGQKKLDQAHVDVDRLLPTGKRDGKPR